MLHESDDRGLEKPRLPWFMTVFVIAGVLSAGMVGGVYLFSRSQASATALEAEEAAVRAIPPMARGASGLPIPRFVSLKSDDVRVRRGPSSQYSVAWEYKTRGLPLEVVAELEQWRRIRDADGDEGWIRQDYLSGWRTVMVAPWSRGKHFTMRQLPRPDGKAVAELASGVVARVHECSGQWCRLTVGRYSGWMEQSLLWGVYAGEAFSEKQRGG